jgi:hypothetical protein
MNDVLNWIKDSLISLFLPSFLVVVGIFLFFYGLYLIDTFNQNIGSFVSLFGITLFFSGLVLPVYFCIKSLFISVKDLSSKNLTQKISGLFGITFIIIFILSYREVIFNNSTSTLNVLITFLILSLGFLVILILITKIIYLIISRLIKFVTDFQKVI